MQEFAKLIRVPVSSKLAESTEAHGRSGRFRKEIDRILKGKSDLIKQNETYSDYWIKTKTIMLNVNEEQRRFIENQAALNNVAMSVICRAILTRTIEKGENNVDL